MHPQCTSCGEAKTIKARGLCGVCYRRAWETKSLPPLPRKPKPLPKRQPHVARVCVRCGAAFAVQPSRAKRGAKFCSQACVDSGLSEWRNCEWCGERFHATRQLVITGNGRFCGHRCHGLSKQKRVTCSCLHCGKAFSVVPAQAAKGRGKYCSRECFKIATTPTIPSKPRIGTYFWRRDVLDRDGHQCTQCGTTDRLHAHHIRPWAQYPEFRYDLANGVTLCEQCHRLAHNQKVSTKVGAA